MNTTQTARAHNFFAGPAVMPLAVLERVREELLDFAGTGVSIMEISHRSDEFMALVQEAKALLSGLLGLPEGYHVLFLQGGASLQFGMLPMNVLRPDVKADYVITGDWAKKAYAEAKRFGAPQVAASSAESNHDHIPAYDTWKRDPEARYLHITTNNTIFGTQYQELPPGGEVPLVADMSSDILWRGFDPRPFGMIYAGAQKNLGPAGVTLVIMREDMLAHCRDDLTTMLDYRTHVKNDSLYNTPPTFGIYVLKLVLEWIKAQGGLDAIEAHNRAKAKLIYDAIDAYPELFEGHARPGSRSHMNITWRVKGDREKAFLAGAEQRRILGLKGHRSVGGCRASTYNALPIESAQVLADYMHSFAKG